MIFDKKAIIWDLDNTLYPSTKEFGNLLDELMAKVVTEDFGIDLSFERALETVKESYAKYRDGGSIFHREYGVDKNQFYKIYHDRKIKEAVDKIIPFEGFAEKLKQIKIPQFVFTYSSKETCKKILERLGLLEIFEGRYYSVEDFGILTKNENAGIYAKLCERIGFKPEDCIFVDDSYSNLEPAKELGMTTVRIFYHENSAKDKTYIDAAYKGAPSFVDDFLAQTSANG